MTSRSTFKVYQNGNLPFTTNDLKRRTEPLKVLLCSPTYFDIVDVKNIHMEGNENKLDKSLALQQWDVLYKTYQQLLTDGAIHELNVIEGAAGCEDMVFCANQTFPWQSQEGIKQVWMSKMRHPSRQQEVPHFEKWFSANGYTPIHFQQTDLFEGMGDTIPHPGRELLYGGYGHRSKPEAYAELSVALNVPVIALELVNENFYHLDTCFVPLSETEVMLCKEAFTAEGLNLISQLFQKIYFISEKEAIDTFCLNAHVIHNPLNNSKNAIIQKGSTEAKQALLSAGYRVTEIDTSEYMKSGGSVFCMKMMYY